ncbi:MULTISPECIES: DinB family protein [Catenuloplanes]|uniref:Damage-inducible protein DinB n=1 Tax=Catenuloplanes niger TaxID=587534 RepID=A0AAE4CT47_9ACTN|nr:DinB family protein [Catenuloplanes niger]MDR7320369.1 putative damage-inducible protein DinB [Catenuloplanes niger]
MAEQRAVGFGGMFLKPEEDPRTSGNPVGELATIREYLTNYRLTLELKCRDLTPEQLAARSVPPSTMSLLGLVRHMARVEHNWFHRVLRGRLDVPRIYWRPDDEDLDFAEAAGTPEAVADAFASWRAQVADADAWLDSITEADLGTVRTTARGEPTAVRDVLVHMIEEYARHCGHADLLRECIDGRTGQ